MYTHKKHALNDVKSIRSRTDNSRLESEKWLDCYWCCDSRVYESQCLSFFTRTLDARNTSESPRQQTKHSQQIIKNDLTKMSKNMSETQNIHNFSFCECYFIHASVRLARVSIDFFDGIFCLATSSPSVFLFCCCCRVFEIRE